MNIKSYCYFIKSCFWTISMAIAISSILPYIAFAKPNIDHIEPPFWWVGMQNSDLQIMVHADNIAEYSHIAVLPADKGIVFQSAVHTENKNYVFINLRILPNAQAGKYELVFGKGKDVFKHTYELKARQADNKRLMGLNPSDVMYLAMPDRFANGDTKNDVVKTTNQTTLNRDTLGWRHGGDIKGVIDHLDYLQDLGITALWLNPTLENNQPLWSYHGYACTNHYQTDPRLGSNDTYLSLSNQCHQRGIKMVMDIIHNHVGNEHWFIKDLPMHNWIHQYPEFTKTTYRATTLLDPYFAQSDKDLMLNGWFDKHMPDLNQDNSLVATYLIQNNIWWVEYAGIDALRLDTYAYSSEAFREQWIAALLREYPTLSIFGETWVQGLPIQIYFHGQTQIKQKFQSGLTGLTDFQLYYATTAAFNENFGWNEGVMRLYETLASDYLYSQAQGNVTFLDNHDLSRYFSVVGEDINKLKMGLTFLLTTRGIPCIYYGTEILMKNFANPDGLVRLDFPGGWQGDKDNKFSEKGRTESENDVFNYTRRLCQWHKKANVIRHGKLKQYVPEKGIYTYFRYTDNESAMIIINSNKEATKLDTKRFDENLMGYSSAYNIITDEKINKLKQIDIPAMTALVLILQ